MINKKNVENALRSVKYPGFNRDIVSFGLIKNINIQKNRIELTIQLTTKDIEITSKIRKDVENCIKTIENTSNSDILVNIDILKDNNINSKRKAINRKNLPLIKTIIAISSGKGGVGKSTISVNLACALHNALKSKKKSNRIGIMDCDIYGPSIPLMLGIQSMPKILDNNLISPVESFGINAISMGLLIDKYTPVVWRGPMIIKAIQQFVQDVDWGNLDVLVIDLPPGTGDAQISLVQTLPVNGAVIVTTPQIAAVNIAQRGANMFKKVNVPILGIIENMSYFKNLNSDINIPIFGEGGGSFLAKSLKTKILSSIPIDIKLREGCDHGIPLLISHPNSPTSKIFFKCAEELLRILDN